MFEVLKLRGFRGSSDIGNRQPEASKQASVSMAPIASLKVEISVRRASAAEAKPFNSGPGDYALGL